VNRKDDSLKIGLRLSHEMLSIVMLFKLSETILASTVDD
jgi:hypothetical protein